MVNLFQASFIIYLFINNNFNNLIARNIGLWILICKVVGILND